MPAAAHRIEVEVGVGVEVDAPRSADRNMMQPVEVPVALLLFWAAKVHVCCGKGALFGGNRFLELFYFGVAKLEKRRAGGIPHPSDSDWLLREWGCGGIWRPIGAILRSNTAAIIGAVLRSPGTSARFVSKSLHFLTKTIRCRLLMIFVAC